MTDNAAYDPGEHTVEEVLDHLAGADQAEQARVFDAERDGKARAGILGKAPFDPSEHTVDEVNAYLEDEQDPEERERVLVAERAGKKRKGVLEHAADPDDEPVEHSGFVDAAHAAAGDALQLADALDEALVEITKAHAAVIADNELAPGEEPVWQAHNRVGFALTDMARPIAALRATAADVRNETSTRGAVDADDDSEA